MSGKLRRAIRRVVGPGEEDFQRSYSQQGDDMILRSLFQRRARGFYVDVGAHHPTRYSNTRWFHEHGWHGINVDALPGSMEAFRRERPRDVNLEIGIAATRGRLPYFRFAEPAVNGFCLGPERVAELDRQFRLLEQVDVETIPLADVLAEHLPAGQQIDFLSVDVEGLDRVVLESNDWDRYRPTAVLAEDLTAFTLSAVLASPVTEFLRSRGYEPCAKAHHTIVFLEAGSFDANGLRG